MFEKITPEKAGISSENVRKFIETLQARNLAMHSVLLMKGEDIFAEYYWKPFDKDFCHRMYSQTKSYVGVAIGILHQEGLLKLNDKIADYFPEKIDRELPENLKNLTIEDMLTMRTCGETPNWFYHSDPDRVHLYFNENTADVIPGTRWKYDSPASQVLCSLVEKLSGMPLFDFLNIKIFDKLGTFKTATILKTKTNDSFGDSALLCTTRDMASFARFVMNYGKWNGEQLVSEDYLRKATSKVADNLLYGFNNDSAVFTDGYGYQIWRYKDNGFAFNGMGSQLTICIPSKDFIFTCTADTQGNTAAKSLILTALQDLIIENLGEELEENQSEYQKCLALENNLELTCLNGNTSSNLQDSILFKKYICNENQTGIKEFYFTLENENLVFNYTNAQGNKKLPFGLAKNIFTKFPQYGYSNIHAGAKTNDSFLYDCATSAIWPQENKLLLKVQIIDKYFGNALWEFSFIENSVTVVMLKNAEAFLDEYQGEFSGFSK